MHFTSQTCLRLFSKVYGVKGKTVIDIGGADINGSIRSYYEGEGMKYICVDMSAAPSVDVVIKAGDKLPFEDASIDFIISSSAFEHDPCFWLTFREMCRVIKPDGYILVNAPSNGCYHKFPGDNWRFYGDAGQCLAYWSGYKMYENQPIYPVKVVETFFIEPNQAEWRDFVCIWKRTDDPEKEFVLPPAIKYHRGPLLESLAREGLPCSAMLP